MIYAEKHLSLLSRMGRDGLQLRFTGEFPEEILDQTCKKIEDMGLQEQIRKEEATQIQRELWVLPLWRLSWICWKWNLSRERALSSG